MGMKEQVAALLAEIEAIRKNSRHGAESVRLIAVSKTQPPETVQEAIASGLWDFGENRVQEIQEKYAFFEKNPNWHLIGHLQTNKVKYIIDKVKMIHSLDSLRLAAEIEKRAAAAKSVMPVLVQVNIADEESKFGLAKEMVPDFLRALAEYPHLSVEGLMTIGPFVSDSEEIRWVFREMRELKEQLHRLALPHVKMRELSMGMSNDYRIAVEEGATMVRVGTAIFGARRKI